MIICAACLFLLFSFKKQTSRVTQNSNGNTVSLRFNLPQGFARVKTEPGTFGHYLQNIELKKAGTKVCFYNGVEKSNKVAAAVLNIDVGKKDLQQCADAVMRLRAEYLYQTSQFNLIHFNFTNGFNALYEKWRKGNRILVKGNKVNWIPTNKESTSYQSFKEYLDVVFTYAGTASLSKELKSVLLKDLKIGDVFIKGGSPGHAVIVMDMAENATTKEKLFMIAQSYMPAQDIHILINATNNTLSPWYKLDGSALKIMTPEWVFSADELKRF